MPYHSSFFGVDVRDEIAREFTDPDGSVDDMLAGPHEIRARQIASRRWPSGRGGTSGSEQAGHKDDQPLRTHAKYRPTSTRGFAASYTCLTAVTSLFA